MFTVIAARLILGAVLHALFVSSFPLGSAENEEKSEVQAIIESTPELDMDKDLSGYKGSRYIEYQIQIANLSLSSFPDTYIQMSG